MKVHKVYASSSSNSEAQDPIKIKEPYKPNQEPSN